MFPTFFFEASEQSVRRVTGRLLYMGASSRYIYETRKLAPIYRRRPVTRLAKCRHNASVFVITVFGFARLPPLVLLSCADCVVSISFLDSTTTKVASYLRESRASADIRSGRTKFLGKNASLY